KQPERCRGDLDRRRVDGSVHRHSVGLTVVRDDPDGVDGPDVLQIDDNMDGPGHPSAVLRSEGDTELRGAIPYRIDCASEALSDPLSRDIVVSSSLADLLILWTVPRLSVVRRVRHSTTSLARGAGRSSASGREVWTG